MRPELEAQVEALLTALDGHDTEPLKAAARPLLVGLLGAALDISTALTRIANPLHVVSTMGEVRFPPIMADREALVSLFLRWDEQAQDGGWVDRTDPQENAEAKADHFLSLIPTLA